MSTLKQDKKSLLITNPDLAKEWDYEKNAPLSPENITYGSAKKVWWKCHLGHSWNAPINNRTNVGSGCPYCAGKRALKGFNDLQSLKPDLSLEWNYEKNAPVKPCDVTAKSNKKAWWKCDKGHEWQATIGSRSAGNGCPYCSNKMVLKGYNDLATVRPDLAIEWNYEKNIDHTPCDFAASSNRKVWWKCDKGHEWQATINNRYYGRNCPQCSSSHSSLPEQGIAYYINQCCTITQRDRIEGKEVDVFLPDYRIAIEYDGVYYHKNRTSHDKMKTDILTTAGVTLIRVIESDNNLVVDNNIFFKVDYLGPNYEWALRQLFNLLSTITGLSVFESIVIDVKTDRLKIRERYSLNEKSNSFLARFPEIATEWDSDKNKPLQPDMLPANSNLKVWWICKKGHSWEAIVESRAAGCGCPYCAGRLAIPGVNDLSTTNPELANEWDFSKNKKISPKDVMANSHNKVWWKCAKGHCWEAAIYARKNGNGCPYCSGKIAITGINDLSTLRPDVVKEWNYQRNTITPEKITVSSGRKVWWKCSRGHEWQTSIANRTLHNSGCPSCNRCKRTKNIDTGEIFESLKAAADKYHISITAISMCCRGNCKTAGGYRWEYV